VFSVGVLLKTGLSNVTVHPLVNSDQRFEGLSNSSSHGLFDPED
jgi:hypothetical protein